MGRALLTMGSQSLSSVTNFLIAALALQAGSLAAFGRFSVVFNLCQLVIVVGQGSIGSTVLVHTSSDATSERATDLRDGAAAAGIALGLVGTVALGVAALVVGGQLGTMLAVAAVGSPLLVSQYVLRARRFAIGDPLGAVVADVVWLAVVLAAGAADVLGWVELSSTGYLVVWIAGAAVSALPVLVAAARRGIATIGLYWQVAGRQSVRLSVEAGLARSVFVTSLITAQALIGPQASGVVAAAVLTLSPLSVIHEAVSMFVVPDSVRRGGIRVLPRAIVVRITVAVVVITVAWIAVVLLANGLVDRSLGPFDLAGNGVALAAFLAMSARFVMLAAWRGPLIALRVADATTESLRARAIGTVAQIVLPIGGFAVGGVTGGVVALAVGTAIGAAAAVREWARLGPGSLSEPASAAAGSSAPVR